MPRRPEADLGTQADIEDRSTAPIVPLVLSFAKNIRIYQREVRCRGLGAKINPSGCLGMT
jgi:hypothetical protein